MPDDRQFRLAAPQDADAVVDLVNSSYGGPDRDLGWTPETGIFEGPRTNLDEVHRAIARADCRILLYETAAGLLGCCQIERQEDDAYFGPFAVLPQAQARGLGRAILAQAEARAAQLWNCSAIWMTVISLQTKLIAYYERRGYAQTGERLPFPAAEMSGALRTDFDLVVLRKALLWANR